MKCLRLSILFLAFGLLGGLSAQQHADITFDAKASKSKMLLNSTVEYEVSLRNASGSSFQEPNFKDFTVISGPGQLRGTSIINGATTTYLTYSWLLQPKKTGQLVISPASIQAAGRPYKSNAVTIEVIAPDASLGSLAPDNFLRVEFGDDTAYVGQQLLLNLRLYTTDNVVSRNIVAAPDLSNFLALNRRYYDERTQTVIENGKEYLVRTIDSKAIYPSKSGEIIIEPFRLLLGVMRYRNPQSSFSRRYTERLPIQTDTARLFVKELPSPRPDNFSGGVGRFRLETNINKDSLSTDEAITLRMTIFGEGDINRITAALPVPKADWVIYDPVILQENLNESPSGVFGNKVLEYQLIPKRPGTYTLSPTLNYFDIDSSDYVDLAPLSYQIHVTQGSTITNYEEAEPSAEADSSQVLQLLAATKIGKLQNYTQTGVPDGIFWALLLLPLLLFTGFYWQARKKKALENADPKELAKQKAVKLATKRLQLAKAAQQQAAPKAFYDAIEDAIMGYLKDKFQLQTSELNKRNIHQLLLSKGAAQTLADDYVSLLQQCELALYARQDQAADLAATYERAKTVILKTEKVEG